MAGHVDTGFWRGKCAIITGASSGIGRELAGQLGARGARVGLIARSATRLQEVCGGIVEAGGRAAWAAADVTHSQRLAEAVGGLERQLGPCDVLIAGAGIYRVTDGVAFDAEVAARVVTTNVNGAVHAIGAVLPGMVERGRGHVAVVSSIAGLLGLPAAGAYCGSKAALIMLGRSLRLDLRHSGVKVTTICPGLVDTPLITQAERDAGKGVMPVHDAARRIIRAIERGRSECGFPVGLWLLARLIHASPPLVRRVCDRFLPRLEEGTPLTPP
ncbi:MAG: SDR family NAD(P)-dependent oxidoreductase [Planctomycetota bacterium]|jgi:short-subunit dehydrogenase